MGASKFRFEAPRKTLTGAHRAESTYRPATWIALGLTVFAALGCGRNGPELGTVSGIVTLDGKPLPGAVVMFTPALGRVSRGRTDPNGAYELRFAGDVKGAVLGEHRVTISTRWMDEDRTTGKMTQIPEVLPPKYNSQTTLTQTVVAGHNKCDFQTTSK